METLSKYFAKLTKPVIGKAGFTQAELLERWDVIAGAEIAGACVPSQIKRPREGGAATLVVRAHAGRALELQYQIPQLVERINSFFGYGAIGAVKLVQGASSPRAAVANRALDPTPVAARLSGFENDDLKAALALLGAGVSARNPQTK